MSINDYTPSEIEIRNLGIGLIDTQYLDLDTREYLVIGDTYQDNETVLQIGQQHTNYWSNNAPMLPRDIKYSMIVNNSGIGINTSRSHFDSNFALNSKSGIYIENGDIVCKGTIAANNLTILNDEGLPYNLNSIFTSNNIVNEFVNAINSNITIAKFSQGWIANIPGTDIKKNNIYTENYINIGASSIDTINNLHPINIVSSTANGTMENIHIAIKNKAMSEPNIYTNVDIPDEKIIINESSGLKIGIIGNNSDSPAIISTTKGMPLEFHVSKSSFDINKLYNPDNSYIIPTLNNPQYSDSIISNYPAMTITDNGSVSIGKNTIDTFTSNNIQINSKLQVDGASLFDRIYIKDYKSSHDNSVPNILDLDDIYHRKIGINFKANQIEPGHFANGNYKFQNNLEIENDLIVNNNLIINQELSILSNLNANKIILSNLNVNSSDSSKFNCPVQFKDIVTYDDDVTVSGNLFYHGYRLNALNIEKMQNLIDNGDGTFETEFGSNLTQTDIEGNVILYYGINSDSSIRISGDNLAVPGKLAIGINDIESYNENQLTIKNQDLTKFEISIEDSNTLDQSILNKTYMGHITLNKNENDKSFIINTSINHSTDIKRNIYFYPGNIIDDITKTDSIAPTLSIHQNNSIGINLDILNTPTHTLHVNGDILGNDLFINNDGISQKAHFFLQKNNIGINNAFFLNSDNNINKYFINHNHTNDVNMINRSKGFNIFGGINSIVNNIHSDGGYYENNIRLATFRYINANDTNNEPKTSYTNANIFIGIDDLSNENKITYVNPENTKPIMIRNLSLHDYNDTVIRLYRGKSNRTNNSELNKANFTGIDFCNWTPITGNKNTEKWYIYRNHNEYIQTDNNYPGVLQFGYTDNTYHPNKAGLEIMYRRNNDPSINTINPINENDNQNYYFIFNRDKNTSLPNDSSIASQKTVKIYGDLDVTGTVHCDKVVLANGIEIIDTVSGTQITTTNYANPELIQSQNDIELSGKQLSWLYTDKTIIGLYDTNIINFINTNNNDIQKNILKNTMIYNNTTEESIVSFVKPYNNNIADFDLKLKFFDDTNSFDVNTITFALESHNDFIIDPLDIQPIYPSIFSLKNKLNKKFISFYNTINSTYINIGSHNNINYYNHSTSNISLHIQDYSKYLLQLTNDSSTEFSRINFHKKSSDFNDFWIFEGPTNNNNFNIQYANNNNNSLVPDNINTIITFNKNKNVGINEINPIYPLHIKSDDNTSMKLINNYNDTNNTFQNINNFSLIEIFNSNLNIQTSFNIDQTNNINFTYNVDINSSDIPDYNINSNIIFEGFKNSSNYIKSINYNNNNIINYNILLPNEIEDHTISFDDFDSNYFIFDNSLTINHANPNIIDINNNILLPSYSLSNVNDNNSNITFEINKTNLIYEDLNSNLSILFNDEIIERQFNIKNNYTYLNNLNFTSNIVNYTYNFDSLDNTHNIHTFYSNIILNDTDTNIDNATQLIIFTNSNYITNSNLNIFTSNYLAYDPSISKTSDIDIILNVDTIYNTSINLPTTIFKDNIINNLISNYYDTDNSINIVNTITCNYLKENIIGTINNIPTLSHTDEIIYDYNINNIDYLFDNLPFNINNKSTNIKFINICEKYINNINKHYLFTNVINDIPHIILENNFTNYNSNYNIGGINKLYSTNDGNFKINYEDIDNNIDKTLINLNKDGNIKIENGSLFVDYIFVDNIFDKYNGNSIILNNSNRLDNQGHINTTSNYNLLTSNINFESSNINFHINGLNSNCFNIKKTGIFLLDTINSNIHNDIINIDFNDDQITDFRNAFKLSTLNNTIYTNIGKDTNARIGIGKNTDNTLYSLDINGQIRSTANNNFNNEEPHIILDTNIRQIITGSKIYNNNLIYSSDGKFKVTAFNSHTSYEKDLITLDNGNIISDSINVNNIHTNNIYDLNGNSLIPGLDNLNNNEFIYSISNLHIRSSNIQFTSSNINIAIEKNKDNYFNINKIRPKEIDEVFNDNILSFDIDTTIPFIFDQNILYSSLIQIDNTTFLSSIYNNGDNFVLRHIIDNLSTTTETGLIGNTSYTDGDRNTEASYGIISEIAYDNINNLLFIIDTTHKKIRIIKYSVNQVYSLAFSTIISDTITEITINNPISLTLSTDKNTLYFSDNNKLYAADVTSILTDNFNLETTIINDNDIGFQDGIQSDAKFMNISSIYVNNDNTFLYVADNGAYAIRKINLSTNYVTTIAGYPPNTIGPRNGIAIGDGIDSRFNNIKKIMLTSDNNFLIILDNSQSISRILSLEIDTNYVSIIYSHKTILFDNLLIDSFNNNNIYIITSLNFYKLEIYNYNIYQKNSILDINDNNNIFSITSIPHDAINIPYYSMHNDFTYNFSNENGYINSMSVKTNKKSTIVQFGTNNEYENAYIGISTEPVIGTELTVNGFIDASNLNISNCINTNDLYANNSYLKCIYGYGYNTDDYSYNNTILFDTNIIPKQDSIYNIGSYNNKFADIYIGANNDINIGNIKLKNINNYLTLNNYNDELGGININDIKFKNKINTNYNYIDLNLEHDLFSVKSYNQNDDPLVGFELDIIQGIFTTSNIITTGNITTFGIIQSADADFSDLHTNFINISNNLYNHYGLYSSNIETQFITIHNDLITSNYSTFHNDIVCDTNVYIASNLSVLNDINVSNLYVSSNLIINENLITSNNVDIYSNLFVGDTITTNSINVNGTITADNLNILGSTTTISTDTYTTENLQIISSTPFDDASLKIIHTISENDNDFNMIESSNQNTNNFFVIDKNANFGINKTPSVELDINGSINLTGSINNLTSDILINLESLDNDILTKFQNSSNYTDSINSNVLNTSNYINDVYNKIIDITKQDFLNDPKHPIIKEYDNQNNLINTYTINDYQNYNIFYKSSINDNEFYVVLRNNTDFYQKHYKLSCVNNLLADILLVGGGGSGKNIDITNDLDTRIGTKQLLKQLNPTNNILTITTCLDIKGEYIFYNLGSSIYYSSIYHLNTRTYLFNIESDYPSFTQLKVSDDFSIIITSNPNTVQIHHLNNFIYTNTITIGLHSTSSTDLSINSGNINGNLNDARFYDPTGIALSHNKEFIIICDSLNHAIKKIDVNTGFVTLIAGSTDGTSGLTDGIGSNVRFTLPTKVVITSDDNFAYILETGNSINNLIRKINLKNNHVSTFKELTTIMPLVLSFSLSPNDNELVFATLKATGPSGELEAPKIYIYIFDEDIFINYNVNKSSSHIIYDLVYTSDNSSIIYLSLEKTNTIITDIEIYKVFNKSVNIQNVPAPGGAGSVLYRDDSIIPKGIYDIYVGNGGDNNDKLVGSHTIAFGATSYGGSNAYINYNDIIIPGNYNGYNIDNSYIIKNNIYDNVTHYSSYTYGGTAATIINSNLNYNGFDGFKATFIESEYHNMDIPLYYGGGAASYDIINSNIAYKGQGGGTNSIDIFNDIYTSNIIHSAINSGGGASGGLSRNLSLYPLFDNLIHTTGEKIFTTNPTDTILENYINIHFDLNTQVNIFINNGINEWCSETISTILKGSYQLIINNTSHTIKLKNIIDNTFIIESDSFSLVTNNWDTTNGDPHLSDTSASLTDRILINISYIIAQESDNLNINFDNIQNNYLTVNDSSIGGSGIVIIKYDINREPINSIEDKLDKRLRLLEESLSFSRINTYNNIELKYYKTNINILYSNIYVDQSYSGIIVNLNTSQYNTVNTNYKYVWNIRFKKHQLYHGIIPDTISQTFNYITYTNLIDFNTIPYIHTISDNIYYYIDNIDLKIYDNAYSANNNAYISSLNYNVNVITPSQNHIMPPNDNMFIPRTLTLINPILNDTFISNDNYYEISSNQNEHIISFYYNSIIDNNNQSIYNFVLPYNVTANILIIAGGGAGGQGVDKTDIVNLPGGGGGAGELLETTLILNAGTVYTIKIGKGGSTSPLLPFPTASSPANQGYDTGIFDNTTTILHCKGGGSGGHRANGSMALAKTGGSSGGSTPGLDPPQPTKYNTDGQGHFSAYVSYNIPTGIHGPSTGGGGAGGEGNNDGYGGAHYSSSITGVLTSYASGGNSGDISRSSGSSSDGYGSGGAGGSSSYVAENGMDGIIIIKYSKTDVIFNNNYNYINYENYKIKWSSANYMETSINEPYLIFNNDISIYGEWKKNQYSNGNYNLITNKLNISNSSNTNFIYGDWIIIKLVDKIVLNNIEFVLKDNIELKEWYIGAINDLPDNVINSNNHLNEYKFDMLSTSQTEITSSHNNTLIPIISNSNEYNTYAILVSKISANSDTLKITNIKLHGNTIDWEYSLIN